MSDTLFALASGPGRAAIAVWRISGPAAAGAVRALTGQAPPLPRRSSVRTISDPMSGEPIDRAVVIWFPGPASFTGEDCAEIHTHGGRAIAEAMMSALGAVSGLRPADPGEFSRRAFLNGKLDLTEAEAIADLAMAETEAQRRQALRQAVGGLRDLYEGWRDQLIRIGARLEAAIEFPEEDIGDPLSQVGPEIAALRDAIVRHLADGRRGERLREGLTIAVVGAPNAGKSSLVNALARRDAAIVSPEAGTTRDAIEVHLDLGGYPVVLVDTAGLREAQGAVEAEGIARARAKAEAADLVVALFDAGMPPDAETLAILDERSIRVRSKADLASPDDGGEALAVSAKTGSGLESLVEQLTARVRTLLADSGAPPPTRPRHRDALSRCLAALEAFERASEPELAADDLRHAGEELGRITGRIDIEETLDVIFRDFCIGK